MAFIGGHGRSGSTLLGRLLGSVDGVFSAGEVCYVWEQGVLRDWICSCGEPFSRCDFWQAVGQEAFGGWTTDVAERGLALRKLVDRNRYVPKLLAPGAFPGYARAEREYAQMYSAVHRGIARASGARVVVDTSKTPSTGYLLRRIPQVDLRVVHLVRDVHGVAYSWAKKVPRADRDGALMTRLSHRRTALEWTAFNALVEGLGLLGEPRLLLRYEDLVAAPETRLRDVLGFVGEGLLPAEPGLGFLEADTVTLARGHEVTGNPMRLQGGAIQLRLDQEWRRAMPRSQRRAITTAAAPGLVRYGYLGRSGVDR
ncbi:sulfotransferase family protein [Phycicoccus endophyticus]|uniref:sulfotransferase family protein n=1 Tax=Phycicoccus endophyticus TaxID=1690220 RepID=UPI00140B522F|nr:sulfotransferase [Phycicoccus endophyticus]NHI20845.1 sulfotransferase [Phycicoccus endophyticus]